MNRTIDRRIAALLALSLIVVLGALGLRAAGTGTDAGYDVSATHEPENAPGQNLPIVVLEAPAEGPTTERETDVEPEARKFVDRIDEYMRDLPQDEAGCAQKYEGFTEDELVEAYLALGPIFHEELLAYLPLRLATGDYIEYPAGEPAPKNPENVRNYAAHFRTEIREGEMYTQLFRFPPEQYPEVHLRVLETDWLSMRLDRLGVASSRLSE